MRVGPSLQNQAGLSKSKFDFPFQTGHELIAYVNSAKPTRVTVVSRTYAGKIQVKMTSDNQTTGKTTDTDIEIIEIEPNQVILEFNTSSLNQIIKAAPLATIMSSRLPGPILKQLLRGVWGNLIFGRVTRVVARAQDVNIWYTATHTNHEDDKSGVTTVRQYLGDNREVLKRFTREEIQNHITFEYDFYFGFCGTLDRHQQLSREVSIVSRARDRIIEEDLEDLCIVENIRPIDHDHAPSHASDDIANETGCDNEYGIHSFHFSSSNYCQPLIMDSTFDFDRSADAMATTTYSVITPPLGTLLCGIPVPSKRGVSLFKWWCPPEPFFHLWKLIQSDRVYSPDYCTYNDMTKLKWKTSHSHRPLNDNGTLEALRFFQELALCAIFNKPPPTLTRRTQFFIDSLLQLITDADHQL